MKPMDEVGNVMNKGDFVVVLTGDTKLYGIVADITEGNLIAPNKVVDPSGKVAGMQIPGEITIGLLPYKLQFNPNQLVKLPNVLKLPRPPQMGDATPQ